MKKLLFLLFVLFVTGCKKDPPKASNSNAPTPTGLTSMEGSLVGKWYLDKSEDYNGGVLMNTYYPDSIQTLNGAYMEFLSSKFQNITNGPPQWYDDIHGGSSGPSTTSAWYVNPPGLYGNPSTSMYLLFGVNEPSSDYEGYIITISSTQLIVQDWSGSVPQGMKSYYHK